MRRLAGGGLLWLATATGLLAQPSAPELRFRYLAEVTDLERPTGVAVAADRWYVVENAAHRVRALDAAGNELFRFGAEGEGDGQLYYPTGIALAPGGDVLVADTGNHRVVRFGPEGEFRAAFGGHGAGPGQLNRPRFVAAGADGVLVSEAGSRRLQWFDAAGQSRRVLPRDGRPAPQGVALSPAGRVFVADAVLHAIQECTPEGTEVRRFGDYGSKPGLLSTPAGLAASDALLYVADSQNHWVQVFDLDGAPRGRMGLPELEPGDGQGRMQIPRDVAVAPDGKLLAVAEPQAGRCQLFAPENPGPMGQTTGPVGVPRNPAEPHYEACLELSGNTLALVDVEFHRVLLHDVSKTPVIRTGRAGDAGRRLGQFLQPRDVWLGEEGELLVADAGNQRLQWLTLRSIQEAARAGGNRGQFVAALDLAAQELPAELQRFPVEPVGVEVAADGRVFVLDAAHEAVLVFDPALRLERWFGGHGREPGQLRGPAGLVLEEGRGCLWVVDTHNRRLQAFGLDGQVQQVIDGAGALAEPTALAFAGDGELLVTDASTHEVLRLSREGSLRSRWGGRGLRAGQFLRPRGVQCDAQGRIFVLDQGNRRCQIFAPDGRFLDVFGVGWYVRAARSGGGSPGDS